MTDESIRIAANMLAVNRRNAMRGEPQTYNSEHILTFLVSPEWFSDLALVEGSGYYAHLDSSLAQLWEELRTDIDSYFPGSFDWEHRCRTTPLPDDELVSQNRAIAIQRRVDRLRKGPWYKRAVIRLLESPRFNMMAGWVICHLVTKRLRDRILKIGAEVVLKTNVAPKVDRQVARSILSQARQRDSDSHLV